MEISEKEIKLTYKEAETLGISLVFEKKRRPDDIRIKKLTDLLIKHLDDMKDREYDNIRGIEPTQEMVDRRLEKLGEAFMALPRDIDGVETILPSAVINLVNCFFDYTNFTNESLNETFYVLAHMDAQISTRPPIDKTII